ALLAEACLVQTEQVPAFEKRGGAENLVHRHHAGAADAHHEDARVTRHLERGLGQLTIDLEDALVLLLRRAERDDGQERRAVAVQTRVVLVAGRLMDLRLAPELRLDGMHAEAVRLHAAVAAALAHRLVDEDAEVRILELAALAQATLLGGAALIVDERGHARRLTQDALRFVEPVTVPQLEPGRPARLLRTLRRVVGDHEDLP